ncbi:hypothetical protein SAMN05444266_104155 [Chitinophaga jiangningensis]|uniref:Nucleotide-binding universal stress protein, UspA family n=1 Tax=Chitinophaga jiangningensis TaxID=1419482 RepID=A0A1M7C109_9BACT|nr:universal stress protein [Chitinophaga jiangningensis]SHL60998.1 hypothetical protein SAMN05444266_104155 [Chitinophaga jiangningensis]
MKKILVVLDGLRFRQNTLDYAIAIAQNDHSHLVGVFLEDFSYHSYGISELVGEEGMITPHHVSALEEHDESLRNAAVGRFEANCQEAGLNYSVHRSKNYAISELLLESVYADLLIIDMHESFAYANEDTPSHFMRHLLAEVACPVLTVPKPYQPIFKVVILFDATPASVQAIRMLNYLLPETKHLPVEVLTVKKPRTDLHLPDGRLMKEFMKRHYPDASYTVLKGTPEDLIIRHVNEMGSNTLVVLGAYARSGLSRWLDPSMADDLIMATNAPLFIAHCK